MKLRLSPLRPISIAVACTAALHGEEEAATYKLAKASLPAAGTEIKSVTTVTFPEMKMREVAEDGKQQDVGTIHLTSRMEETLNVQEGDKVIRTLTKSDTKVKGTMNGEDQDDEDSTSDLLDKKVTAELKDGRLALTTKDDDGEVEPVETDGISDMLFSPVYSLFRSMALYGDAPHKPGDKWDVDLSKLDGFAFAPVKPEGKLSAEFVKVVEIDGEKCAEVHFDFDLSAAASDTNFKAKGEETVHRRLSDLVDVDTKISQKMEMLHAEEGSAGIQSASGDLNIEQTSKTAKP